MKCLNTIVKILAAIAAIAGTIYLIATYGDKIVAWAKKMMEGCSCCSEEEAPAEEAEETAPVEDVAEEAPVEEAPAAEEVPAEEAPAEEAPAAEDDAPVANEEDFEA